MFTGIIEAIGIIIKLDDKVTDKDFTIAADIVSKLEIGDSIAVNGVCLTVREKYKDSFLVSAANETLKLTNLSELKLRSLVNLESSLTLNKPLGGHLVQGHVAQITKIIDKKPVGEAIYYRFAKPASLDNYIVKKGYIAVDGMSLTIVDEEEDWFEIMLIPHTLTVTIASGYAVDSLVNLEVDIFARYMEKLYEKSN